MAIALPVVAASLLQFADVASSCAFLCARTASAARSDQVPGALYLQDVTIMPKLKTHKGAARRMQYSGSGKLMRTRQGKSHLRRNKSKRAAGEFDEMFVVAKADLPRLRRLLPYAKKSLEVSR